jgi:hypothetical protein
MFVMIPLQLCQRGMAAKNATERRSLPSPRARQAPRSTPFTDVLSRTSLSIKARVAKSSPAQRGAPRF